MHRLIFISLVLSLAACSSSRTATEAPLVVRTVADLDASGDHFAFYNLRDDRLVPLADSASTDWDLAFRSTTILVNGGASGPGMGGAVVLTDTTFDAVTEAPPADSFAVDAGMERTETAIPGGAGNGWYAYDFASGVVSPRPAVLVIRTANGRFAKLAVESYYRGAPAPADLDPEQGFRVYTFRTLFQPDGSRRLR